MNKVSGQLFLIFVLSVLVEATQQQPNSNHTMNWSDAVQFCSERGMVLRKTYLGLDESPFGEYWTRIYKKESDFVYLYGCLNALDVNISKHMARNQCIKECLHKKPNLFVMQEDGCSCVSDPVPELQPQCDLNQSPLVFGTIDSETFEKQGCCVLIDCHKNENPELVNCDEKANVFCRDKEISGNFTWKTAAKKCMEKGVSFNFELNKVCSTSNTTPKKKYWFGFGTFEYTDEFIKYNGVPDVNQTRCQSCEKDCKFEYCNMTRKAACESNMESISATITKDKKRVTSKERPNQPTKDMLFQTTNLMHDQTTKYTKIKVKQDKSTKEMLKQTKCDATKDRQVKTTKEMLKQTTEDLTNDGENKTIEQLTKGASDTTIGDKSPRATDVKDPNEMVAVYCLSILVAILSLLVFFLLYLRCRNQKKQILENKSGIPNNTPTENMALTTAVYELADNSKLDIGDPNHTDAKTVKEPASINGSIGGETKLTVTWTNEDVYNHLWETPADSCPEKENIYNQCNLGREEIYKYGVSSGTHSYSATVNADNDHVTLVSANVETTI